jgi:hypothetical protein
MKKKILVVEDNSDSLEIMNLSWSPAKPTQAVVHSTSTLALMAMDFIKTSDSCQG